MLDRNANWQHDDYDQVPEKMGWRLRDQFPDAGRSSSAPYCVMGGAFGDLLAVVTSSLPTEERMRMIDFPDWLTAKDSLILFGLYEADAEYVAGEVIRLNDEGYISEAWNVLEFNLSQHYQQIQSDRDLLEPTPGPWLKVKVIEQEQLAYIN